MSSTFVDSTDGVQVLLKDIKECPIQPPLLFLDLEGVNLSRHGSIAIMQLLIPAVGKVYIVDIHFLKQQAFNTHSPDGTTLKNVLESTEIPKVFFDVRNDSDALFSHFQISLRCVIDVQLLEFATRPHPGKYLRGLSKCIDESAGLTMNESRQCQKVKDAGLKLFAPERGGTYQVFHIRPLPTDLLDYCVQDVVLLPKLLLQFTKSLPRDSASKVQLATLKRVAESQSTSYQSNGPHKAVGPNFGRRSPARNPVDYPMSIVYSASLAEHCIVAKSDPETKCEKEVNTRPTEGPQALEAAATTLASALQTLTMDYDRI